MSHISKAYLTFALGEEKFAIPVDYVQEVVELEHVTRVPQAPPYMLGIINLRGRVLPLLDTKMKLGLPASPVTRKSRIMILDLHIADDRNLQIGAMVDIAREVIELHDNQIQQTPDFENVKTTVPVTGLVNDHGDITLIMDINRVFSFQELTDVTKSLN
ncbi:MAG TPA: chemotaxis protein CheW [Ohtaekwangia sp.]|uniref:chemotaxis protein CheW n=1 Tax=Ohtaekwangia sp. TaxID=2066019 RepID=UPI002F92443E